MMTTTRKETGARQTPLATVAIGVVGMFLGGACSDAMHEVGINPMPDGGGADTTATPSPPVTLPSDELAKRLAKLIWNTTPDAALTASTATVKTRADVGTVARQMLQDSRARVGVGAFYRWWLNLDMVPTVMKNVLMYPQWTVDMGADAARETEAFAVAVTLDMNGSFQALMNGQFSYVNQRLAALYGLPNVTGTDLKKVNLDTGRAGLLTHPSLLAMNSQAMRTSPTLRGNFVRNRFYCTTVPSAPGSAGLPMVTLPPNPTTRQTLEAEIAADSRCGQCHIMMDPIGFAFEGFDTIGRVRTTDNGSPVDTTGQIKNGAGVDTSFKGPVDLVAILTGIDQVQSCLGQEWLSYALGRVVTPSDATTVAEIHTAFKAAGLDIRALIAAVAQSDLFLAP